MGTRATWRHVLPGTAWSLHCPCVSADHRATGAPRGWAMSEFAVGRRVRQPAIPGYFSSRGVRARAAAWLARRAPIEFARRFMGEKRSPRGRLWLTATLSG